MSTISVTVRKDYIKIRYSHGYQQKVYFTTGVKAESTMVNPRTKKLRATLPKKVQDKIDEVTNRIYSVIEELEEHGFEPTTERVKAMMRGDTSLIKAKKIRESQPSLFKVFYQEFLPFKAKTVGDRTLRKYIDLMNLLMLYEQRDWEGWGLNPKSGISDFDYWTTKRLAEFVDFLHTYRGHVDNTVMKYLSVFRSFLKETSPTHHTNPVVNQFSQLRMKENPKDVIYWTSEELDILYNTKLQVKRQDEARDLILFSSATGMRYSDMQRFHKSWIYNDMIYVGMQQKTHDTAIVPILPYARYVLEKYDYKLPDLIRQKSQYINKLIKLVCKNLKFDTPILTRSVKSRRIIEEVRPKHELLSIHCGRKTFITISLESGIPLQDVMKMTGKKDYKSMKPYIHISERHLKDVSAQWGNSPK